MGTPGAAALVRSRIVRRLACIEVSTAVAQFQSTPDSDAQGSTSFPPMSIVIIATCPALRSRKSSARSSCEPPQVENERKESVVSPLHANLTSLRPRTFFVTDDRRICCGYDRPPFHTG